MAKNAVNKRMELTSTSIGQHLAQHPYHKVKMLNAGVEVSGPQHCTTIAFNQLMAIRCKRGVVWGELEFELLEQKVVRLHGTEWRETQHFYQQLLLKWQQWSDEMSVIAASVLQQCVNSIKAFFHQQCWLTHQQLTHIQTDIDLALNALPLPLARLTEFPVCRELYLYCQRWLLNGSKMRAEFNQRWLQSMIAKHQPFFNQIESQPLNEQQCRAVICGEKNVLVLAGAGSGKTSVLIARVGWLLYRRHATADQLLVLAFGRKAADEMNARICQRLNNAEITTKTFHALALSIIEQCNKKPPVISVLETDIPQRYQFLIEQWQALCTEKKSQRAGWRNWLTQEMGWMLTDVDFWQDQALCERLVVRLDNWLGLIRDHNGNQSAILASAPQALQADLQKKLRLLMPLHKAWKRTLKAAGEIDFSGLLTHAIDLIEKRKFVSSWRHILIDEFQDISPSRAALIMALRRQQPETNLYAVGDDWQSIYRFSGADQTIMRDFKSIFGADEQYALSQTYRFNQQISDITSHFIQQNPAQSQRKMTSQRKSEKAPITLLPDTQLEALLNKLSSYVKADEKILILGRYHFSQPAMLANAATRWPHLNLEYMTIHASKGQQADEVIVVGLHSGQDGFPSAEKQSVIEQALLPQGDDFPDAEERRLLYVALTRAKRRVWLLQNTQSPSIFVQQLVDLGAVRKRKP